VYDEVAGRDLCEEPRAVRGAALAERAAALHEPEEFAVGLERDDAAGGLDRPTLRQGTLQEGDGAAFHLRRDGLGDRDINAVFGEHFGVALRLLGDDHQAVAALLLAVGIERGLTEAARVCVGLPEREALRGHLRAGNPAAEFGAERVAVQHRADGVTRMVREGGTRIEFATLGEVRPTLSGEFVEVGEGGVHRFAFVDDDERVLAEVIEDRAVNGERAIELGGGEFTDTELADLVARGGVAGLIHPFGQCAEFNARREPLRCRPDPRGVDLRGGALRVRVEHADRLDLRTEELDAERALRACGEHIDQPTAACRLPGRLYERDDLVASVHEFAREPLEVTAVAARDRAGATSEVGRAEGVVRDRTGGSDDERWVAGAPPGAREGDPGEDARPTPAHLRVVPGARVGEGGTRGEVDRGVTDPGAQLFDVRLRVILARHDEQHRVPNPPPEQGHGGRLRGVGYTEANGVTGIEARVGLDEWVQRPEGGEERIES
jgi:hypothetical protein